MRENKPKNKPILPDRSSLDITDEKFDELTKLTVNMVENVEIDKSKDFAPMLMVHFRQFNDDLTLSDIQSAIVVVAGGFNPDTKQDILHSLGNEFFNRKHFPVAVFMISEAWMSHIKPEEYKAGAPRLMPSEDPNRKECIMIAGRTVYGECKVGINIPIIHDAEGIIRRDGENAVTKELEMYLLNNFFHVFSQVAGKVETTDEDIRPGRNPQR